MNKNPTFREYLKPREKKLLIVFLAALVIFGIAGRPWLSFIPLMLNVLSFYGLYKRDVIFKTPKK